MYLWIFKVIFTFFYHVKQYREKKHKMQGFIQMYNGAFLHNMGKKSQSRPFSIECGKGIFDKIPFYTRNWTFSSHVVSILTSFAYEKDLPYDLKTTY